ncbi:MAG TPA: heme ABC transporter substrate-binding protein IsdE [Bacillota bacterium]|nr:heme ABC transporter substrate-binding protein IsdE [Bacillota bacterium]
MMVGLLLAAGCASSAGDSQSNSQSDVTAEEEEDRIVATTVALTEIMDKLELDLVGIPTSYKDLPERYAEAEEVGNPMEPDMEIIKSLQPTDVLSVTTLQSDLEDAFEKADIPVTFIDLESVEGMYDAIRDLGEKYDRTEQAEQIVNRFEKKLSETEKKVEGKESPTVLILLGVPGSYLVATENSYVGDLVKRAGGINAIQDEDREYIASNTENLQQSNPDVILRMAHGMPDEVVEMFDKEFAENDIWKHFKAVQNDRVYDLEETRFGTTANLAAPEALEELVEILYPEESN